MENKENVDKLPKEGEESRILFKYSNGNLEFNENLNDSEKEIVFKLLMGIGFILGFDPNRDY